MQLQQPSSVLGQHNCLALSSPFAPTRMPTQLAECQMCTRRLAFLQQAVQAYAMNADTLLCAVLAEACG